MPKFRKPVELALPEKAVVAVHRAEFSMIGRHDAKGDDVLKPALVWTDVTSDPEVPDFAFKFTLGSGWEIVDGGARVKGAKPDQAFNIRSGYGYLIDCVLNTTAPMAQDGYNGPSEFEAAAWNNTKWLMEAEEIPGIPPRDGQRPPQRMKVVQYLGPADAAASAAASDDAELEAQLMILAASAGDNRKFLTDVLANPALRAYIQAQKLSSELTKGTLYARLTS